MPQPGPVSTSGSGDSRPSRPPVLPLLVHLLAAASLLLVPSLCAIRGGWHPARQSAGVALLFAAAYLCVALPLVLGRNSGERVTVRALLRGLAAFSGAFVVVALAQWKFPSIAGAAFPSGVAFAAFALGMLLLFLLFAVRGAHAWKLALLVPSREPARRGTRHQHGDRGIANAGERRQIIELLKLRVEENRSAR